jgi:hypothetical protein
MRTVQGCHLLLGALVEKIAFFHETRLLHVRGVQAMATWGSGYTGKWRARKK